jgi:hypothetical protein
MSAPTKQIGDRTFAFGTIPATKAVRVEVAIARVIGEPLFKAFVEAGDKKLTALTDEEKTAIIGGAIATLTARMDPDELLVTMGIVFESVTLDGKPVSLDVHFNGRNREVWQVFIEALRVNFSDFFPAGLSASLAGAIPK